MSIPSLSITGLGALSVLGADPGDHVDGILAGSRRFRPLGELLGCDSPHAGIPAGWIADRDLLIHRKWSPVTMAALHVARRAVAEAGWSFAELRDAALVVGTSRGNAAGWLSPWPGRRPFRQMRASNTIHSEPASAISIELGITGPNHVLASGCAAGLDAVGLAMMLVRANVAARALAVAVDLPLVPVLLDSYADSGMLSRSAVADPYHPSTDGFIPAEGAAAIAIESHAQGCVRLLHYGCNADACDPLGIPADGGLTPALFKMLADADMWPDAVSPHATGTAVQRVADPAALGRVFSGKKPTLHLLKPYAGHTIGASGLLESVILAAFLRDRRLPPNPPGLTAPPGFILPAQPLATSGPVAKLSHAMGGHNALLILSPP